MEKKKLLGEILEQKIREEEANKLLKLQRETQEKTEKEQRELKIVMDFAEKIKNSIIEDIGSGKTLRKIILGNTGNKHYNKEVDEVLHTYSGGNFFKTGKYKPVWDDLTKWAESEKLSLNFEYQHDGVGMHSWYQLKVAPLVLKNKSIPRKGM